MLQQIADPRVESRQSARVSLRRDRRSGQRTRLFVHLHHDAAAALVGDASRRRDVAAATIGGGDESWTVVAATIWQKSAEHCDERLLKGSNGD